MKRLIQTLLVLSLPLSLGAVSASGHISTSNIGFHQNGEYFQVSFDLVLDSLHLGADKQIYITPVVRGADGAEAVMPTVLVNGRNMHYAYERGSLPGGIPDYDVATEVRRFNGRRQRVAYFGKTPMRAWMRRNDAAMYLVTDTCGCGRSAGRDMDAGVPLNLNPVSLMRLVYITPEVTELPVAIHEGRARVQFEVDRTELHADPYVCRNGQRIDNRGQLKIICDSVRYAIGDPNVEIASVNICGYASPESPYSHNDYLATNRSRALAEYIGQLFSLPSERCTFSAVPENWEEFRQIVAAATDITPRQRAELIELIDRTAYGPSDYDAKERTLKTDPRFAALYRSKILPEWFPQLRCTKFTISTRLRPMTDSQLADIIHRTPELMSLNQMFRVARLYPEGSDSFNEVIDIALRYYPDSPVANLNAAVAAMARGHYSSAAALLEKAGDSPEAENARGVLAVEAGDFERAAEHFHAAGNLPEANANKAMIDF